MQAFMSVSSWAARPRPRISKRISAIAAVVVAVVLAAIWLVVGPPRDPGSDPLVVTDVTKLNPIQVSQVVAVPQGAPGLSARR